MKSNLSKHLSSLVFICFLVSTFLVCNSLAVAFSKSTVIQQTTRLHMPFIANQGQVNEKVRFYANGTMSATPGNAQVTLDWTAFSDTGSGIGNYKVVFSKVSVPTSRAEGKQIYKGPETTYTHTGLTNGTTCYYRVCAIDNAGNISTGKKAIAQPQ